MTIVKVILLAVVVMAMVVIGLAIQTLFKKGGTFPDTHIGSNKFMKDNGVTCAQTFDKMEQAKVRKERFSKKQIIDQTKIKSNL